MHSDLSDQAPITVYWRPGCGFCHGLLARLEESGLTYGTVNIWDDEEARAFVRSVARGNETVPTVTIGAQALVNPSMRQILAAVGG